MSKLYLIPTPIGNLEDITLRALRLLRESDLILAEDTRQTGILLQKHGISKPLQAHHAHNEHGRTAVLLKWIKEEQKTVSLVSDAGTPGISDPGFFLVRECIREQIAVECLPGPTALIPALVQSGLPCERFCFEGFLPHKKGRQTRLKNLVNERRTMVFYESPHRLCKALAEFAELFGTARLASVSRELSKLHEETKRGTLGELLTYFGSKTVKGEIVIVVQGSADNDKEREKEKGKYAANLDDEGDEE